MISEIRTLDLLKLKFNLKEEDARSVIEELQKIDREINEKVESEFQKRKDTFLTKDDKVELIEKIQNQKVELVEKIENQKVELVEKIEKTRSDMIKWMFIFWISQLAAIFGMLKVFFAS